MRFGDYIKDCRQRRGWTQPDAAKRIGIEQSYLSKLETGKSYPSEDVFSSLRSTYEIALPDMQHMLFPAELDQLRDVEEVRNIILRTERDYKDRVQRWLYAGVGMLLLGGACFGATLLGEDQEVTRFLYKSETEINAPSGSTTVLTDIKSESISEIEQLVDTGPQIVEQYKSIDDYRGVVFRETFAEGQQLWRFYGAAEETIKSPLRWFIIPAIMLMAGALGCFFATYRSR